MVDNSSIEDKIKFFENSSSKDLGNFLLENLDILEEDTFYKEFFITKLAEVLETFDKKQAFYFLNWLLFESKFSDDVIYINDIFSAISDDSHIKDYVLEYFNTLDVDGLKKLFTLIEFDDQNITFFKFLMEYAVTNNKEDIINQYFIFLCTFDENDYFLPAKFICMCGYLNFDFCPEYFIDFIIFLAEFNKLEQYPELIDYLNYFMYSSSCIAIEVMNNQKLVDYLFDNKLFLDEWRYEFDTNKNLSIEDLNNSFFVENSDYVDDSVFCKKLSAEKLIYFTGFNDLLINDNMKDDLLKIISMYLSKFVNYKKAVFLVDLLNVDEIDKEHILCLAYPNINHTNIKNTKDDIINRNLEKVLNNITPVDDEFKNLLPELLDLPFNEDFFLKIKNNCLNISCIEYLQVFMSQLIKYICIDKELMLNGVSFYRGGNVSDKYYGLSEGARYEVNTRWVIINHNMYGEKVTPEIVEFFLITIFHELRHAFQFQMCDSFVSVNSLLLNLQKILTYDVQPNSFEVYDYFVEVDARIYSIYETFKFLKEILNSTEKNLDVDKINQQIDYLDFVKNRSSFLSDRNKIKDLKYFCNLLNGFESEITKEAIIQFIKKFKVIELITDESGRLYSTSEIQEIIDSIKSYNTNDIEYNSNSRNIRLFYMKYLKLLNDGKSKGYIKFEGENTLEYKHNIRIKKI